MMSPIEQKAVVALLVHAALADGEKSDAERAALRRMSEAFPAEAVNPWVVYQEVLAGRSPLEQAAKDLQSREARLLAYEMAVGVCDTDGAPNAAEQAFLRRLSDALGLPQTDGEIREVEQAAQQLATAVPAEVPAAVAAPLALPPRPTVDAAASDKQVLQHSILAGALELLPQSLATMAIVPLQMKLVYGIGQAHGYSLDRGHIREFMGAAGAGLAAQAVEGYARKLLGGLVGGMLGKGMMGGLGRTATRTATGAAITFAATYALGQLAIRYYSGGRSMEVAVLKDTYTKLLSEGQNVFTSNRAAVEQRAATLSPTEIINFVRQ